MYEMSTYSLIYTILTVVVYTTYVHKSNVSLGVLIWPKAVLINILVGTTKDGEKNCHSTTGWLVQSNYN